MIWIISGPSSVGKTSFLKSRRIFEITQSSEETPSIDMKDMKYAMAEYEHASEYFLHYDFLRPSTIRLKSLRDKKPSILDRFINAACSGVFNYSKTKLWKQIEKDWSYSLDREWLDFAQNGKRKKAIVLATNRTALGERVKVAAALDQSRWTAKNPHRGDHFSKRMDKFQYLDLIRIYDLWFQELTRRGIDYTLVDSTDSSYPVIDNVNALKSMVKV